MERKKKQAPMLMRLLDSRGTVAVEDGVDLGVPLELEVLAEFLADGRLDGL